MTLTESTPAAPPKLPRLPALDALRGFGASIVVLGHVAFATGWVGEPYWGWWLSRSEVVVSMFFVLSGFVLFRPFANAKAMAASAGRTRTYMLRRFMRITPAYWLTVIISLTLLVDKPADTETWVRHLTYTQFYGQGHLLPGIGQAWTLTIEAFFYLTLPLLGLLTLGKRWRPVRTVVLCLAMIPVSLIWALAIGYGYLNTFIHPLWFFSYASCFGIGMAMATIEVALLHGHVSRAWQSLKDLGSYPWAWFGLAIGLYAVVATPVAGPRGGLGITRDSEFAVRVMLYAIIGACLVIPVAFGSKTRLHRFLGTLPMRWMGNISFGLFLWHPFVMHIIDDVSGVPPFGREPIGMYLLTMAGSIVAAAISWYLIEKPAINWSRTRSATARPVGRKPKQDNSSQPGELGPDRAVPILGTAGEPGSGDEERGRQQPEPAPGGPGQPALVALGHPAELTAHHEEEQHPGDGHQHPGQTADGDQRETAEQVEALTAETVPSRYTGRAIVAGQNRGEQHEQEPTGAY
jgi:peptidoglycan/LPS O-acetylase OafA/YrhL